MFFEKKFSNSSEFYYLETSLYPSITDIVEAINTLIQERHNHNENCTTVKVSQRTQNNETYFAKEKSGLSFFRADPGHVFGSNVGNDIGVILTGKRPHKPEFAYHFVRIHCLMLYMDLIEHNISATQRFHCSVASFLFRSSRLEIL